MKRTKTKRSHQNVTFANVLKASKDNALPCLRKRFKVYGVNEAKNLLCLDDSKYGYMYVLIRKGLACFSKVEIIMNECLFVCYRYHHMRFWYVSDRGHKRRLLRACAKNQNRVGWPTIINNMGRDARNPVFGVSDKVRFKPACSATETSKKIKSLHVASLDRLFPIRDRQRR